MQTMQPLPVDLLSRQGFKRAKCTCRSSTYAIECGNARRRYYEHTRNWGARWNTSSVHHDQDCALFRSTYFEREDSWQLRLMCYRGLIGRVVQASLQLRRGAGGFSINPSLSCIRVVDRLKSPAFQLILYSFLRFQINRETDFVAMMRKLIRDLQRLFQDGRASPRDVTPSGETLFHVGHLLPLHRFSFCFD